MRYGGSTILLAVFFALNGSGQTRARVTPDRLKSLHALLRDGAAVQMAQDSSSRKVPKPKPAPPPPPLPPPVASTPTIPSPPPPRC